MSTRDLIVVYQYLVRSTVQCLIFNMPDMADITPLKIFGCKIIPVVGL